MTGASQPGAHAGWAPAETASAPNIKLTGGPTVNLSAVSATLSGAGTPGGFSSASSPYAHGSSTHSSPSNISRTGSGVSDGSAGTAPAAAAHGSELLRALSGQGGAAGGAGQTDGSRPASPAPAPSEAARSGAPLSIEATLQGLSISGASSPAAPAMLTFTAPASGALPPQQPVEVFAQFPQEPSPAASPSGRGAPRGRNGNGRNGEGPARHSAGAVNNGHYAGGSYGGGGHNNACGYAPGSGSGPSPFYAGSPPGGYPQMAPPPPHMFLPGPMPAGAPAPAQLAAQPAPTTAGFQAAAYYPHQAMGQQGGQQGPAGHYMMHPFYAPPMVHPHSQPYPQHGHYLYPGPPPQGGAPGTKAAYEAAEYQARQYQAMMQYMQGFGMMVSPSGSPERASRSSFPPGFRRNGGQADRREEGRGRPGGRPSRLSLDMSASKSENGDAHKLDPELAPLVAEDKCELQCPLLEEYKATREGQGGAWALQDLRGSLYPFCRDQHGSRLVQQQLEGADAALVAELFGEVQHKLLPLMVDVFGNYVVQRFLERGGSQVHTAVSEVMRGKVLPLALQMYGCRVVQKALEVLPQEDRASICGELTEHTLRCVRDQNGNHVVQKCVECVQPSDPARPMIEIIVNKVQSLSTHTFGCRLVQRVLEFCTIPDLRNRVTTEVLGNALQLSHDQYGNYVVQHLVTKGPADARELIVGKVAPQVMTLAHHKYASNVVEACLKHGGQAHRDAVIEQMIAESAARPAALNALMRDQYGNYVVQRALEVSTPAQRSALLCTIKPHLESLKKYTYGKHIVTKAETLLAAAEEAQQAQQGEGVEAPAPAGPEEAEAGGQAEAMQL